MLCLDGMYLQGPEPVLLRLDHQADPPLLILSVGIIAVGEEKPVSVELPVPGRETSERRGCYPFNSRRFLSFQPYVSKKQPLISEVPG